jgi:hypothetical protein
MPDVSLSRLPRNVTGPDESEIARDEFAIVSLDSRIDPDVFALTPVLAYATLACSRSTEP